MNMTDQELVKKLPKNHGVPPLHRLRWRFYFHDKTDKRGGWNGTSRNPNDMACFVKKSRIAWAVIEAEKIGSWVTKEMLRIPGEDYAHATWDVALSAPMFLKPGQEFVKAGDIVGLTMFTNDQATTVFVDGQIRTRELTTEERKFNVTEHRS